MMLLNRNLLALCAMFAPAVGDPIEVDFASLSDFDYVEGMTLPAHVTKLDKKSVKISGFMAREEAGEGPVEYFLLINDACGCEGMPMLNEVLFCAMPAGQTTEIQPGTITVTGTLYVGELEEEGYVVALYCLDVDRIGP